MEREVVSSTDQAPVKPQFVPRREDFAEGKYGDKAFRIIASGALCEAMLPEDEKGEVFRCGFEATQVVDVNVGFEREFFPSCSLPHTVLIGEGLRESLKSEGKHVPIIGWNGGILVL